MFTAFFSCGTALAVIINVPFDRETIQEAINVSQDEDTILVARGRYFENFNFNGRNIVITSNFIFSGEEDDIVNTIIDGGRNGSSIVAIRTGETATLTGFTLTNGETDYGGAVYCRESSPTFSHLIVENNTVSRNGGGIYCTSNSSPVIHDVIIRNNTAGYVGGGFGCFGGSTPRLTNVLIYDNYCDHVGAAIHCHSSVLNLDNVTVANNRALHSGGAVYVTQGGVVNMVNSIFWADEPDEVYVMAGNDATRFIPSFSIIKEVAYNVVSADSALVRWGVSVSGSDPLFTDLEERDYHLTADSPCIDAGNPESPPDSDETRSDIGFHYFHQEEGGSHVLKVPEDFIAIQEAIDEADDNDFVLVYPGEYFGNINFEGKAIKVASRVFSTGDVLYIAQTVIDASDNGTGVTFENDENENSMLMGFRIINGTGTDWTPDNEEINSGGGVLCISASPVLKDLQITGNRADIGGGIGCFNEANPAILDCEINSNSGQSGGGAACYYNSSPRFVNTAIVDNSTAEQGGGVQSLGGSEPEFSQCMITGNRAGGNGGGASLEGESGARFSYTLLAENVSDRSGGGLSIESGINTQLMNCTLSMNSAGENGGSIFIRDGSTVEITNSILFDDEPQAVYFSAQGEESAVSISFTDIEGGIDGIETNDNGEVEWGDGNISLPPMFAAPEWDFSLTGGSPCIDTANPDSPRDPDGTLPDMGAIYFHQQFDFARRFTVPDEYETIQEAIEVAQAGDTVLVMPGRYRENISYRGKNILIGSLYILTRDPAYINETILDGDGSGTVVMFTRAEYQTAVLAGFTIENGAGREGGAIFAYNSQPTIRNCVIRGNNAEDGGAGVYSYGGWIYLHNCTIYGNEADAGSGGIQCTNLGGAELVNTIVWDNEPSDIEFSADRDWNSIRIEYSDIEGGEMAIVTNNNGSIVWNEGNIEDNPDFTDPGNGDFSLAAGSSCIDAGDPGFMIDPDGTVCDMGAIFHDQGLEEIEFTIALNPRWNLISTPVSPQNVNMESIWSQVVEAENLLLLKNHLGEFYYPEGDVNRIPYWDVRYGYWAKLSQPDSLVFVNRQVAPTAPIPLEAGWSIVAYYPPVRMDVMDAFALIEEDLIVVKDQHGRFYMPAYDFSNMPRLQRGRGYQVKTGDDVDLIWNVPDDDGLMAAGATGGDDFESLKLPVHLPVIQPSGRNMSCLLKSPEHLSADIEIAAFTAEELCVGSALLSGDSPWGLAVWGDDPTTEAVDGAQDGETIHLKTWSNGFEHETRVEWSNGTGVYTDDGFALGRLDLEGIVPFEFKLADPFPNPFNSTVRLQYEIADAGRVELFVYDISGREIANLEGSFMQPGRYTRTLDADRWASGLYFIRLESQGKVRTAKLACVK